MLARRMCTALCLLLVLIGGASCGGGGAEKTPNVGSELLVLLPVSVAEGAQGIRLFPGPSQTSSWSAYRVWPRGKISIFHREPNSAAVAVRDSGFSGLLPRKFVEFNSQLFLFAYNPAKFNRGNVRPVEVWKVDPATRSAAMVAENLAIGGIEDHLHVSPQPDRMDACDQHACVSINSDGRQVDWFLGAALSGRSIVEAAFVDDGAFAILRSDLSNLRDGMANEN